MQEHLRLAKDLPETERDHLLKRARAENWIYIPEFTRAMRDAYYNRPREQRDAWLLWIGL